jgi:hypothetical protein
MRLTVMSARILCCFRSTAGAFVARLVTDAPTAYILLGHTLAELHAQLPAGLERASRQPGGLPEVAEVWFPLYRRPHSPRQTGQRPFKSRFLPVRALDRG